MFSHTQQISTGDELAREIREEVAHSLGVPVERLPADVNAKTAGSILDIAEQTLATWRSTGRYDLPYIKVGRKVRYRVRALIDFKLRHTYTHTGQAQA